MRNGVEEYPKQWDQMSGMVYTGLEVHRMDSEISRLVE